MHLAPRIVVHCCQLLPIIAHYCPLLSQYCLLLPIAAHCYPLLPKLPLTGLNAFVYRIKCSKAISGWAVRQSEIFDGTYSKRTCFANEITSTTTSKDFWSTVKSTDWVEVDPEWEPGDNNDHAARKVDADDVEGELPDDHKQHHSDVDGYGDDGDGDDDDEDEDGKLYNKS